MALDSSINQDIRAYGTSGKALRRYSRIAGRRMYMQH